MEKARIRELAGGITKLEDRLDIDLPDLEAILRKLFKIRSKYVPHQGVRERQRRMK